MTRTIAIAAILASTAATTHAQQFFSFDDGTVDFVKPPFADTTDQANWDIISDTVAITRDNNRGIYNPLQEPEFQGSGDGSPSPVGTRWLLNATVQDVINGTRTLADFTDWLSATGNTPPNLVNTDAVLYLEAEDAYVDIRFNAWGQGGASGGLFAYTRAEVILDEPCLADVNQDGDLNGLDFGAWLGAFNAQDPRADQNQDNMINGLDFGAWLSNFNAGCD